MIAPSSAGRAEADRHLSGGGSAKYVEWMDGWIGGLFCRRCGILVRFMHCSRRMRHVSETMAAVAARSSPETLARRVDKLLFSLVKSMFGLLPLSHVPAVVSHS